MRNHDIKMDGNILTSIPSCDKMKLNNSAKGVETMAKKKSEKKRKNYWKVPKDAKKYFDPHYDDVFKANHPILYWLTFIAIIVIVMIGPLIFLLLANQIQPDFRGSFSFESAILIFGLISSFAISIGIANLFMIVHKQYLGIDHTLYD